MSERGVRISVLVADDHPVYREGLERTIKMQAQFRLVASCGDGRETLVTIQREQPEVAVIDVQMPNIDGIQIAAAVKRDALPTRVVLLTGRDDPAAAYGALANGAAGYLSKASDHLALVDCIASAARGETRLSPQFAAGVASEIRTRETNERPALTDREGEVLRLLAEGGTAQRMADAMCLSKATVKTHLHHIYGKFEVSDRAAAVATAMRRGLLE
jgi:two-component system nitrate/nitrite response regulator NarL